jgi:hypothetical protein
MKYVLKATANLVWPYMVSALVVYLFGSFGNASFNPVDWTSDARWFCIIWAVVWGLALWDRIEAGRTK